MTEQNKKFITADECVELAKALETKYRIAMNGRSFSIKAENTETDVSVSVLLESQDKSFHYPVDARVKFESEEMTANEAALFLIDYIDIYFEEFLLEEDESLYLPIEWNDFEYEAVNFQMKGQIFNRKLDNMADELLKQADITI